MKTKPINRNVLNNTFYTLVLLLTSIVVNAQCPTIVSPPASFCDASGLTFNDLSAFATDNGNGIVWYDLPTGGSPFNPNELVYEGTYYADDNSGACGSRPFIVVDFDVDASGQNLDGIYCGNDNPIIQTYVDEVLTPNIPSGGSVNVYTDSDLTTLAVYTDPIPAGATNFFIVFLDALNCESQIEVGSTAVFNAAPDPTPPNPQEFCSDTSPTVGDLNPGTTDSFSWYLSIDGSGNPVPPSLVLSTPLIDGNTYYVQVNDIFCDSNPVPVVVTIDIPADSGTSATLPYCSDSVPTSDFNLFDNLGGADTTGVWSGPLSTSNGHLGTVNISSLTTPGDYVFTYTVASPGICPDATSTVTITIYETFTSGIASAQNPASFCETGLPSSFDLFSLLDNEDPDGLWTQGTSSSDPAVTTPIDLTGFTPGTYDFTYTQNVSPNPCPEESTTVQVIILPDPNAGNALNTEFCENDLLANSPFNLFTALDGTQDNNLGTWTDFDGNNVSNPIDISAFTITGSPYQYNYTINNGTCEDVETISITILPAPESGNALQPVEICEEDAAANSPFDLFTLLDGTQDSNGTWYEGTDTSGTVATNPIDISAFADATYNYTYSVPDIGSCSDVDVTVQIILLPQPETGTPTTAIFCENDLAANSPLDLFGQLSGEEAGGTWADDDGSGALTGSDVNLTLLTIGSYNFTYSITSANGCSNSSTVIITVEDAPESGNALQPVEICEEDAAANSPFDLFTLLDGTQDSNGTWYEGVDTSGTVATNPIDISAFADGTYNYTYSIPDIGSCSDVDVTVQIILLPQPETGTPTTAIFCENDLTANSPLDLFGQLSGEETGGTWADDDGSGALTGSDVDLTLLTIGSYNFTYSITSANGCSNSSTVIITVEDAPESGTPNPPVEFCIADITSAQTYNLFDLLEDEDQTGTWSDDDSSGALSGNIVTIDGLTQETYNFTYDVNAIGTCDDILVTVSIVINDTAVPTATISQEFCDAATVSDLTATGTTIQWYEESSGGTPLDGTTALVNGETYYATQTDSATGCESSTRLEISVTIYASPNAGSASATPILECNSNSAIDLNTGLDGTQDSSGVWQDTDSTGALTGNILDATGLAPGDYQFTYFVMASPPCIDDSTTITITIEGPLTAGNDTTLDICSDNGTTDLFTLLGTADTGGAWSPALTSGTGVFDPLVDASGTYTYELSNACGVVSSDVVVSVIQAPNAGTDNTISVCVIDGTIDLFTQLVGTPDANGTWSPMLTSGTGVFDPSVDSAGVYTYLVSAVAPCTNDASAQITISISNSSAPTVNNANPTFCQVDNPTISDLNVFMTGVGTLTWYTDTTLSTALTASDILEDGEDYFATLTETSGCESSQSASLIVTINDAPTPTLIDEGLELCVNDAPTLFDLTLNITEYDSTLNNVIWYDAATDGTVLNSNTLLVNAEMYYASLIDPVSGCESSIRLEITPDLTACGTLVIPDGFSPNGDGVNDTFDVFNLDVLYPNFVMEIYNRYGNLVYKGSASTPRFNGKSNQSGTLGSGNLPVGVYYYIFNYNDNVNKPVQGRLYLNR